MGKLVLRDLPEQVEAGLQRRAAKHGRSLEAEVHEVLLQAAAEVVVDKYTITEPDYAWIKRLEMHPLEVDAWEVFDQSLSQSRSAWRDKLLDPDQ